ncbi:MAG: GlsB/YeaQ/YmgE family stress response membrane protein [Pseudomonadota bacterium]
MLAGPLIATLVIGLVAGWTASFILDGGRGMMRYLIYGSLGSIVGGLLVWISGVDFDVGNTIVNQMAVGTLGAMLVVLVARRIL